MRLLISHRLQSKRFFNGGGAAYASQYFFSAAVNVWKLAEGQHSDEFSRTSQYRSFAHASFVSSAVTTQLSPAGSRLCLWHFGADFIVGTQSGIDREESLRQGRQALPRNAHSQDLG